MLQKGEHIDGIPNQLQVLLEKDEQAYTFFKTLSPSYKKGYCDWVGAAKAGSNQAVKGREGDAHT